MLVYWIVFILLKIQVFQVQAYDFNKFDSGFSIQETEEGLFILTDASGQRFLMVSSKRAIPKKYQAKSGLQIVRTPIQKVLVGSITHVSQLRALQVLDRIVAVTMPENHWRIPEVRQGIKDKKIYFVGNTRIPDLELIRKIQPEIATVYTGGFPQTKLIQGLKILGIPYIVNNAYTEKSLLDRLSWIGFLAFLFERQTIAQEYLEKVERQFQSLQNLVQAQNKHTPKTQLGWAGFYYGDIYVARQDSYVGNMIQKSGAFYAFKDIGKNQSGNSKVSLEAFYQRALNLDVLILSVNRMLSLENILLSIPIFKNLKVFKNKNIWSPKDSWYQNMDKSYEQTKDLFRIVRNVELDQVQHFYKISR